MVEQYKTLGLPVPTPSRAGISCTISTGQESFGETAYAPGSVIIGIVVDGKDSTMQCTSNGTWKPCPGCLLTTIPSYLQNSSAYKAKYVQAGELPVFDKAYNECKAVSKSDASCVDYAVQIVSSARIQNAYTIYEQAIRLCGCF